MIMFLISAVQSFAFVLIGNYILEIKDMTISYWLVLFTTSCFANMLGLNISSAFNSVITIYILIPFIIIPQLLFSGVLVKFDKLHQGRYTSVAFTPVIGDLMAARWSFEALAVKQFKNNRYERNFFKYKMDESNNTFYASFLINALKKDLWIANKYKDSVDYKAAINSKLRKVNYYLDQLSATSGFIPVPENLLVSLNSNTIDSTVMKDARSFLDMLAGRFQKELKKYTDTEDSVSTAIISKIGSDKLVELESNYHNKSLEDIVLDRFRTNQFIETENRIVQKYEPGYMKPLSNYGRAHLYAPYKLIGNIEIDTFWFDLLVLWVVSGVLYLVLYFNFLQKLAPYIERLRFRESDR
jgi:hypothetical protein